MITVTRTGAPPLVFEGEEVASSDSRQVDGSGYRKNRWHEVQVWRTAGGNFVASIRYRTCWQGEEDLSWAKSAGSASEISVWLRAFDATEGVLGYPDHPAYASKRARLDEELRQGFEVALTRLFATLGDAFAERVD